MLNGQLNDSLTWLRKSETEPLVVSNRPYRQVFDELAIDPAQITEGTIVSIGEGLSDTVTYLSQNPAIQAIGLDPIYQHLHPRQRNAIKELEQATQRSNSPIVVRDKSAFGLETLPATGKEHYVTGSVYDLPIPAESTKLVLASRLMEHMDSAAAFPEMVRILAKDGEIRLGYPITQIDPSRKLFFPHQLEYDGEADRYYVESRLGVQDGVNWLIRYGLHVYVYIEHVNRRSEVRDQQNRYNAGVMIIRKDEQIPVVSVDTELRTKIAKYRPQETIEKYPFLGSLWKIKVLTESITTEDLQEAAFEAELVSTSEQWFSNNPAA